MSLAPMPAERSVDAFVEVSMRSWTALLQTLIRERSVFEREHGAVEVVRKRLTASRVPVSDVGHQSSVLERLPGACPPFSDVPGRTSLVARLPGAGGGRSLAFSAHLDIVPEGDASRW